MIEQHLQHLGLSPDEIRVYLEVLEVGSASAGKLSQLLKIPRSTVYDHLARLTKLGLINSTLKSNVKTFIAERPERLHHLYEQRIKTLQQSQSAIDEILPQLEQKLAKRLLKPKLKVYEGRDGVRQIMDDITLHPGVTEVSTFWPIQSMLDHLGGDHIYGYNVKRIRQGIFNRRIYPELQPIDYAKLPFLAPSPEHLCEIRLAPPSMEFEMGYFLYKNRVGCVSSRAEGFGFIIESEEFHATLMAQFEFLWAQLPAVKLTPAQQAAAQAFLQEI